MAAQHKKHTELQLSGLYTATQIKECPSCKKRKFVVIESRRTFDAVRRRYECSACSHRDTMYEISSAAYEELRLLRSKLETIRKAVADVSNDEVKLPVSIPEIEQVDQIDDSEIPCMNCVHLTPYGCSFDIPEAQSEDAKGCNLFQPLI